MGGGVGDSLRIYLGWKYTPLYEKGIKKNQNKSMETTKNFDNINKKTQQKQEQQ